MLSMDPRCIDASYVDYFMHLFPALFTYVSMNISTDENMLVRLTVGDLSFHFLAYFGNF